MRYLLVGLGNPGKDYSGTRHNAGYWLVDMFAESHRFELFNKVKFSGFVGQVDIEGNSWIALKPTTYMNRSGIAVRQVSQYFNINNENIIVAHDELDFEPGIVRFKRGGGHGGHNGLRDMIAQLGGSGFARLRIGIGRGGNMSDYVLKAPAKHQQIKINSILLKTSDMLPDLMGEASQKAVQELHSG